MGFSGWRANWLGRARDFGQGLSEDYFMKSDAPYLKWLLIGVAAILLVCSVVGWYWSQEPEPFNVVDNARAKSGDTQKVVGVTTTATLIRVTETLLDKRGGYLSNDIAPPGVWLDNIPGWEYGVLTQARELAKAMEEAFSRSQSQSKDDSDLVLAKSRLNYDHQSWLFPATESEYRDGIKHLQSYLDRLTDNNDFNAQFYSRADNLNYWLRVVETKLGSLSQRLSASVGRQQLNVDLAGDPAARQATPAPEDQEVKTSWFEIDDVFYEARGSTWALMHFLQAVEVDFADVLEKKNARVSVRQIIRELEGAQQPVRSPLILNGNGFGLWANHSLVMASYISRANAALIDLRELLTQG